MERLGGLFSFIAAAGVGAQWLAWRFKIPAIVLLALAGLMAGPLLGWIHPSEDLGELFLPLIKLGVALILFDGGLNLRFGELKETASGIGRLVTMGVVLSLVLGALAAHTIGGLSWPVAWVFGAIIVVTGPTVILPLLRQARLKRRPAAYLKWEGIINDPVGALLAVLCFEAFVHLEQGPWLARFWTGLPAAFALGGIGGYLLGIAFRKGFVPEYLKGPMALAGALSVYAVGDALLEEAGLLAVTVMGLVLGNMRLPSIGEMRRFKEYIAVLLVSGIFILLTAGLDPSLLAALDARSLALLAAVLFLVRPLSILAATWRSAMDLKERLLVAWIAPRGVVAAAMAGVFGPALAEEGHGGGEALLPLVFALVLVTVVIHGFSLPWLAGRLGLSVPRQNGLLIVGASPWAIDLAKVLQSLDIPVMIADTSWHRLRAARLAGVPVFLGELLSEASEQTLEFGEFAYLFAATDNDAYNALVCTHFAHELGRSQVFQLPEGEEGKRLTYTLGGRITPSREALFERLMDYRYLGWAFHKTTIAEDFSLEAFCREACIPFLVVREGNLVFNSPEQPLKPKAGDVMVWFGIDETTSERPASFNHRVIEPPPSG